MNKIEDKVIHFIKEKDLFSIEDKILVALSGGADSVALLCILHSAGYHCEAAHCNFHLRGAESDRDEHFVRQLCKQNNIALHTADFDTLQYAHQKHISIEMAARQLRYDWFERLRKECNANVIAVAHHQDDSVETMLLNLIRGTGIAGLSGIRPSNGAIVRPLLCIDRKMIIEYLREIGQKYVTDSTNLTDAYTRNKIRLKLLPLMEEINPSIKRSLIETANRLSKVATIYNKSILQSKQKVVTSKGISIDDLLKETAPEAILFEILHPLGFNPAQINDIFHSLTNQSGKRFCCNGWEIIKDRDYLLLTKEQPNNYSFFPFYLIKKEQNYDNNFHIPSNKNIACFDADKLRGTLSIRKWRNGDSFIPFGMKGKKKISDYLTDHKFSINEKKQQWVLCCDECIAWLIGERIDNRFRIDNNTQKVIIYEIISK